MVSILCNVNKISTFFYGWEIYFIMWYGVSNLMCQQDLCIHFHVCDFVSFDNVKCRSNNT